VEIDGVDRVRAEGRLFAYRVGRLQDFRYHPELPGEDLHLAAFLRARSLTVTSVPEARVRATPAGSYDDFYRQTLRHRINTELIRTANPWGRVTAPRPWSARRYRAFLAQSVRDPVGAAAYLIARGIAALRHRLCPEDFSGYWPASPTTKA
jgi:hypothetical protein